jgi:FixJ family two-component response regulator
MEEMVRRTGAADYLRKPFALKDLTKAIDAAIYGRLP